MLPFCRVAMKTLEKIQTKVFSDDSNTKIPYGKPRQTNKRSIEQINPDTNEQIQTFIFWIYCKIMTQCPSEAHNAGASGRKKKRMTWSKVDGLDKQQQRMHIDNYKTTLKTDYSEQSLCIDNDLVAHNQMFNLILMTALYQSVIESS